MPDSVKTDIYYPTKRILRDLFDFPEEENPKLYWREPLNVDCNAPSTFNGHEHQSREDVNVRIVNIDAILDNDQNMDKEVLGLSKLANQLITKAKGREGQERDNHIHDKEDQEYIPEENDNDDLLNMGVKHDVENENQDGQAPSKRMMSEETRKRKDGRSYKQSYEDTLDRIISV
ncbi:hypothetical protein Cgig2_017173 [Carnegiea gigantea]|uniref:Uncharacterized protein n=1 Tax=Carnegiea gigantea TaxID=171969 RepID=A0A9Q1QFF9_9CARY|nr:hypothetical protein Cgig2_017173 [Carnegiea gigantea]